MEPTTDLRRFRSARTRIEGMLIELGAIEDTLSFAQGDEMQHNAANSNQEDIDKVRSGLLRMKLWVNNAVDTETRWGN